MLRSLDLKKARWSDDTSTVYLFITRSTSKAYTEHNSYPQFIHLAILSLIITGSLSPSASAV